MRVYKANDYNDMSRKAANILSAQIILKPNSVLGLATGSSPLGVYRQLIEWYRKGDLDFSEVITINLDEYVGLAPEDPRSYRHYMEENFFRHVNIRKENVHIPDGLQREIEAECLRYDDVIESCAGIDMQLLGLGHNGHIGFNEPGGAFEKKTHCAELTQSTIDANKRFFTNLDDVPKRALTMGIRSIMHSRSIVLIASGKDKADIVKATFHGPITPQVPASILQLHNNVIIVGDEDAMSKL